ncbi:hypothetical protein RJT34_16591 [Clitoria ternatea]|uniref:Uncharacterized protein n=1 Tax=Clitoria ternatea TaxID=43366 RepID=A0AAN9PCG0_CLITE
MAKAARHYLDYIEFFKAENHKLAMENWMLDDSYHSLDPTAPVNKVRGENRQSPSPSQWMNDVERQSNEVEPIRGCLPAPFLPTQKTLPERLPSLIPCPPHPTVSPQMKMEAPKTESGGGQGATEGIDWLVAQVKVDVEIRKSMGEIFEKYIDYWLPPSSELQ